MKKQKVLIIGGGSTGLSTALEIAKTKKVEVRVLEKDFVGSGQTGKCCGFIRNFYNAPEMITSAHFSMKKIKAICQKNPDLKYQKLGLLVFDNLKNKKFIKENVKLLKRLGVKAEYFGDKEINNINPFILAKNSCAGFDFDAGYINPQLMIDYLKIEADKAGVKIYEKTEVLNISRKNKLFIVDTNRSSYTANKVFNATAGFTNNINKMLGFSLPIKTIKINNTFYRLPLGPQKYLTAIADFENSFYIIPHEDFIDVSSMTLDLNNRIDPNRSHQDFNDDTIEENLVSISKRIIGAEKSATLGGFGSHIDVTDDYYPVLGSIDKIPNFYFAAGFSGTGFKHFPMISLLMKEIILEEKFTFPKLIKFFQQDRIIHQKRRKDVKDSYFVKE